MSTSAALVFLLKEIAKEKKITQQEISDKTGMAQPAVSRFFKHKSSPTLSTFIDVARAVGVNFFFEDKESNSDLSKAFERAMDSLGRRELPKN
jgi:transcriptional regulator with XRE-family HTH domain